MQVTRTGFDRAHVLREAIHACRKGGVISIPGVYGGIIHNVPMGAAFAKGLTFKMGQTHMHRYLEPLLERVQAGDIDPTFVITHTMPLDDAPHGYRIFRDKQDECIKIVLKP
jgi:threonine dehydrogenase-like Zn-dependent dehydrogenase